ncbi:RHS repeat-associated core domain-containing protein [Citrobacter freundii]|nr:RHS repeat-associated core domain-containing protein [Citrobacter freundii]
MRDTAIGYTGQRRSGVSGYYLLGNGYRGFNPVLKRFAGQDSQSPFGEGGEHGFAYCGGNPVNKSDPSGHGPLIDFIVALAIHGARVASPDIAAMEAQSAIAIAIAGREVGVSVRISEEGVAVAEGPQTGGVMTANDAILLMDEMYSDTLRENGMQFLGRAPLRRGESLLFHARNATDNKRFLARLGPIKDRQGHTKGFGFTLYTRDARGKLVEHGGLRRVGNDYLELKETQLRDRFARRYNPPGYEAPPSFESLDLPPSYDESADHWGPRQAIAEIREVTRL